MLLVLLGICIVGIVVFCIIYGLRDDDISIGAFVFSFLAVVVLIPVIFCTYNVKNASVLQTKIVIIEQQNAEIEQKVSVTVNDYLKHESTAYQLLSPKDAVMAAMVYPSLASNTIVQKQIEVYQDNNNKITDMKLDLASVANSRWWLYFGK